MPPVADLKGKKQKQPSSCPDGWLTAALVVQLELTHRQEKYARRAVGIARFVYNRTVANDQAARDTGLWLTPHELEKEFNSVKQTNSSLAFTTQSASLSPRAPAATPTQGGGQTTQIPANPLSTRKDSPAPARSWQPRV